MFAYVLYLERAGFQGQACCEDEDAGWWVWREGTRTEETKAKDARRERFTEEKEQEEEKGKIWQVIGAYLEPKNCNSIIFVE